MAEQSISEVTRRRIFDLIASEGIAWWGRIGEIAFLERLYDLTKLPSTDYRYKTADLDIRTHRIAFSDWEDDWVFYDKRFKLLRGPDSVFVNFLAEMLHPVVRASPVEVDKLVAAFNEALHADGWELYEATRISARSVFAGRRTTQGMQPGLEAAQNLADQLDASYVSRQITRMESAVESDPELAIGTAKEFVETVCRTILDEHGEEVPTRTDLPSLVRQTLRTLDLVPEKASDRGKAGEVVKRVLMNLATISDNAAALRNIHGSGHGKKATTHVLEPRHARLAVGAASTLAVFLYETHRHLSSDSVGQAAGEPPT